MKKVLLLGVCLFTFSACSPDDGRLTSALIGGAAGGIMGNTIGGGSGKTTASIGGAIIGTLVGLNNAQGQVRQPKSYNNHVSNNLGGCGNIVNTGARSACERGVSERNRIIQREMEQRAYQCGRYGRRC
jgi:outer membrane lipoprotein SlyB|tara:strand:- start:193 stop:579 length:387 start_codon:yes stop_codon:yes gene_type:complete